MTQAGPTFVIANGRIKYPRKEWKSKSRWGEQRGLGIVRPVERTVKCL